jgi:hypothetical protein
MKVLTFLLVSCLILSTFSGFGQTVNNVPLKDINVDYVQIVGTSKLLSTKVTIEIDFGQRNKMFNFNDTSLKDENGKLLELNSMIDALNFMCKNGYEFVQAYAITIGSQNVYHYLMRKKQEKEANPESKN